LQAVAATESSGKARFPEYVEEFAAVHGVSSIGFCLQETELKAFSETDGATRFVQPEPGSVMHRPAWLPGQQR